MPRRRHDSVRPGGRRHPGLAHLLGLALAAALSGCSNDPGGGAAPVIEDAGDAASGCPDGSCIPSAQCPSAYPDSCGSACVSLSRDEQHCGDCDTACPIGALCQDGSCACGSSHPDVCEAECVDVARDVRHCGGCGSPCGAQCRAGVCVAPVELALGGQHTLARMSDGSIQSWGFNGFGQLGDGTTEGRSIPAIVPDPATAVALSAGRGHSCAVLATGAVCWGDNAFGQLGDAVAIQSGVPLAIAGLSDVQELAAGGRHTCARQGDGTVQCWGWNANGQIGDGTSAALHLTPAPVLGLSGVAELAAGGNHTCARRDDGTVACWGDNAQGQLGNGASSPASAPVEVSGVAMAVGLAAGARHSCALLDDGAVECWGDGALGQLGDGTTTSSQTPVAVSALGGVVQIAAGDGHTCARLGDGTVSCWGAGDRGQLGEGSASRSTPAVVPGLERVADISLGGDHACARRDDGATVCWGSNAAGQLGDGGTLDHAAPAPVSWP